MFEQILVFATLAGALALFVWGRWRYDVVAMLAFLTITITGIVDGQEAFSGFGHPAVITVAAVLVISRALSKSGLADLLASLMTRVGNRPSLQVATLNSQEFGNHCTVLKMNTLNKTFGVANIDNSCP